MLTTNKPEQHTDRGAEEITPVYCYIDVETTGVEIGKHGIIQLSGKIETEGQEPTVFDLYCRPHTGLIVSDEVLSWHGLTREALLEYEAPTETLTKFKEVLSRYVSPYNKREKIHFIAYNARFDMDMLRDWFNRCGDKYFGSWFWFPPIDVMGIAAQVLHRERPRLKDFKLATVAAHMGLDVDASALHEALYDVELTKDLYLALLERAGNYN
jgi:DNA polymerase-3 subunit epsilon